MPDYKYYLAHQVHPVVSRLCAPMEGTSAGQIADCLGLDPSKFHAQTSRDSASAREDALLGGGASLDDEDRYVKINHVHSDGRKFGYFNNVRE